MGNVALAETELCTNQGCKALVLDAKQISSEYALVLLQALRHELQSLATGTTFTEISGSRLGAVPVPLPPLEEQDRIVKYIGHVDARLRRYVKDKRALVALLHEQKQTLVQQEVLCGGHADDGLAESGVPWLGQVPATWEVRRAKWYYREVDHRSETGEEELMSVSHITGVTRRSEKNVTMFKAESYVGHKLCAENDIVVNTMWAWMGALGVAPEPGIVSPSYAVYRPVAATLFDPGFIDYLLRSPAYIAEYVRRSTGIRSSRLRLYPDQFLDLPLVRPPLEEQREIVSRVEEAVSDLDRAIRTAGLETDLLLEYRARLVFDVVTGRLDVRDAARGLPDPEVSDLPVEAGLAPPDDSDEGVDLAAEDDE